MISKWTARRFLVTLPHIFGQAVAQDLIDGETPRWAISLARWYLFLLSSMLIPWIACAWLPEGWVTSAGQLVDSLFWNYLKETKIRGCTESCRDLAFGLIVTPLSWILGPLGALRLYFLAASRASWNVRRETPWLEANQTSDLNRFLTKFARSRGWYVLITFVCLWWYLSSYLAAGEMTDPGWRGKPAQSFTGFLFAIKATLFVVGISMFGSDAYVPTNSTDSDLLKVDPK